MLRTVTTGWAVALCVGLTACGSEPTPVSPACTADSDAIVTAATKAGGPVRLPDGTRLSDCVHNATDEAQLQDVGIVFSGVAETLGEQARAGSTDAAHGLGFVLGATRRGAKGTAGILAELQRRIERVVGSAIDASPPPAVAAIKQGLTDGERDG